MGRNRLYLFSQKVVPVRLGSLAGHSLYKYGPLGSRFTTIFPKESSAQIVTERKKEREIERDRPKLGRVCWWLISDRELACVVWRSIDDEYQRQGEGPGEGLEHSRAHAQGEWDGPNHPTMTVVEFRGTKKSKTSQKRKEAAGVSGEVDADGANPTVLNPTEVRVDGAGLQMEQDLEPGTDGQKQREQEDDGLLGYPVSSLRWILEVVLGASVMQVWIFSGRDLVPCFFLDVMFLTI
ncbi:hypothetical protein Bca52824_017583 [Brassica carinata]|uniref:Uncharacterized protein n=1 Tax=Brassica carinata TaxID=52824 RepID=A0A8X7VN65_BRACI|nr:hypothetical protein Bca52824_017583 [Brassica carinata]